METERMIGRPEAVVGGTEGGPGPTRVPPTSAAAELAGERAPEPPDPAVPEKASRRRFGAEYKETADSGLPSKNWSIRVPRSRKPEPGCRNMTALSNRCSSSARARGTYPRGAKGSIAIGESIEPAATWSLASAPVGDGFVPAAMRRSCPQAASIRAPFRRRT